MGHDQPKQNYKLNLDYGNSRVVLDYNESILENEDRYNACLSHITERIDWCIRQSYKSSTDSP